MDLLKREIRAIPLERLEGVEEMFFRQIQMDGHKALKKFGDLYEETRSLSYAALEGNMIFEGFVLEQIKGDTVYLKGGASITSSILARVFEQSEQVVICAATLHGFEELECGLSWVKKQLEGELREKEIYATPSWSPGQHHVDIKLQRPVFDLLHPEEIGITLNDTYMMHPKKSISGLFGLGREKEMEQIRACDFCEHRETCPTAYV